MAEQAAGHNDDQFAKDVHSPYYGETFSFEEVEQFCDTSHETGTLASGVVLETLRALVDERKVAQAKEAETSELQRLGIFLGGVAGTLGSFVLTEIKGVAHGIKHN